MDQRRQAAIASLTPIVLENVLSPKFLSLPKAELHVHLEGSVKPPTAALLAAKYGVAVTPEEVLQRYACVDFRQFIEAFKWVTSLLREPNDYVLLMQQLGDDLLQQNVSYAEVTLSVGVMLLRQQQPQANFEAIAQAAQSFADRGLKINFVFDAVRQFGVDAAMRVVEAAKECNSAAIVAFGIGGDELSISAKEFKRVYDRATSIGLHRLIHAGEIGGPDQIRDAIDCLQVERIGHGIAAIHDRDLMDLLAKRKIPLEICPQSNLRTGALSCQTGLTSPSLLEHPLPYLFRHGIPVVLSTDDPAMFDITLTGEYEDARRMGLREEELAQIASAGFEFAFGDPGSQKAGEN